MEKEKKIITYNDIQRSTEPLNWRRLLNNCSFTIEELSKSINDLIEERRKEKNT